MKKLRFFLVAVGLVAVSYSSVQASEVELMFGPKINVKNWFNQFNVGLAFGGEYFKYGFSYSHASPSALLGTTVASASSNAIKMMFIIDVPFTFKVGEVSTLSVGPTIDFGPEFSFLSATVGATTATAKMIDLMTLGFGLKVKYYFSENFGVAFTPVHFTNSFAYYATGGTGFTKQYRMTYDLLFSALFKF